MNILPKKRWHVRTKDNIARVRRDEAAAREEEEKRKKQVETAESEARLNFLRKQIGIEFVPTKPVADDTCQEQAPTGHIDLFADLGAHIKTTNKEAEKEKKEEQEKYEKQIGYLTYLGQDTNEALKLRSWYEVAPNRALPHHDVDIVEKDLKLKQTHDPLTLIKALLPAKKIDKSKEKFVEAKITPTITSTSRQQIEHKKHKKEKKNKKDKLKKSSTKHKDHKKKKHKRKHSESDSDEEIRLKAKKALLEQLREERLRREATERARQEALLQPKEIKKTDEPQKPVSTPRVKQKYNSQFNPEIAKQNM